jgi:hypothetical protein
MNIAESAVQQHPYPLYGILINAILLVMTLGILAYSLMYSRRVYQIFRLSEVPLFFNNLCITLSCVMYLVNSSLYIAYLIKYYQSERSTDYEYLQRIQQTVIGLVFMFMFFAFQFDLYKWSIFIASSSTLDKYT